jgi:hypothetical protein
MNIFRALLILLILIAVFDVVGTLGGSWRQALSTMVTFSNQVTLGIFIWCIRGETEKDWFRDILSLYETFLGTTFFFLIVPLNGVELLSIADIIVHALIPIIFVLGWKKPTTCILQSRLFVYVYPVLFLPFIFLVSYRRGYMIYPILNPLYICLVGGILETIRFFLAKIKQ